MKPKLMLLLAGLFFFTFIRGQELFTGVWRAGTGGYYLWAGVNWQNFNQKWSDLGKKNYRLVNIKTYMSGNTRVFAGVWNSGTDGYALTPLGLDWTAFSKFWADYSKKGQRLINVETYSENGKLYFLGVFRAGNDGYVLTPLGLDWSAFNKFWDDNSKKGQRLINIESYMYNGKRCFLGVFRAGSDGYVLSPYGKDWSSFKDYWKDQSAKNLRLVDVETFVDNGKRIYLGVWRSGSDGYYLWGGVTWESLTSKWAENAAAGLRLMDLETFDSDCDSKCLNQVLMPDDPKTSYRDGYDYGITAGTQHCEGQPTSCPVPASGDRVYYRWPNIKIGDDYYVRNSVLYDANDRIFTLPFKDAASDMWHNAWLYSPGSWHHAIDYARTDAKTFQVCAAAAGKVIYIGWDTWSGNTMVISHDADGKKDVYRTIYMHLQNGPDNDCDNAWTKTMPTLKDSIKIMYTSYLQSTGCPVNKSNRNPQSDYWGTDSKKITMNLGQTVSAGQPIAWSGSTGPGGCGCTEKSPSRPNTHLHIFFAHKDATDNRWYFIDPYGIYSFPDCYPKAVNAAANGSCALYPVTWKGGSPQYAQ